MRDSDPMMVIAWIMFAGAMWCFIAVMVMAWMWWP
jgi:hypothetical protein